MATPLIIAPSDHKTSGRNDEDPNSRATGQEKRYVINISNSRKIASPTIIMTSKDLVSENPRFLIDTGSKLNLIKEGALFKDIKVEKSRTFGLTGISDGLVQTLGTIHLKLLNINCEMNVVPDDFPIPWEGILGVQFLRQQNASFSDNKIFLEGGRTSIPIIDHEVVSLPARSKTLISLRVKR